jgi:dihydrofolate reductase
MPATLEREALKPTSSLRRKTFRQLGHLTFLPIKDRLAVPPSLQCGQINFINNFPNITSPNNSIYKYQKMHTLVLLRGRRPEYNIFFNYCYLSERMDIIIIAAMAANRVIGRDNSLPWSLPEDLYHFKETTLGHALIMGRKTYESLGHPLPGRMNVVISRNKNLQIPGCLVASELKQALALCKNHEKIFIIGGGQIFRLGLSVANTLILTVLDREVSGNVTFPDFSEKGFTEISRERHNVSEPFSVITYQLLQK